MQFHQPEDIPYYQFDSLRHPAVVHAVFSRHGGLSPEPWDSLNVGGTVGDDPQLVVQNRRRAFRALGRRSESIYDVWQVHSARVVCTQAPRNPDLPYEQADIILTDRPGVTLFMRFADCVPLLLFDPVRKAVGIAHAGWKGTVNLVARAAVEVLGKYYGSRPADILAGIGPSIGPDHYDIGPEVIGQVHDAFGSAAGEVLHQQNGFTRLDLWAANHITLAEAGVEKIEVAEICTACQVENWYSHRAEHGRTGRFGALIALAD